MKGLSKEEALRRIRSCAVMPIFYNGDEEKCMNVLRAIYEGGIKQAEFTNRAAGALGIFERLHARVQSELPDMLFGAGTVIDGATASAYINAGAAFIVSPVFDEDAAELCAARRLPYMPGCMTPSEIQRAYAAGADVCKLFPADCAGGPAFIKALRGPMPWIEIMPTGGISTDEADLAEWFKAGAFCVGIGSKLISKEDVDTNRFDSIKRKAQNLVKVIKKLKEEL